MQTEAHLQRRSLLPRRRQTASMRNGQRCWREAFKVVSHGRYVTFQMAEVAVLQCRGQIYQQILSLIARVRALPTPA
jgi:hypothetical protein